MMRKKKILWGILLLTISLSLTACGQSKFSFYIMGQNVIPDNIVEQLQKNMPQTIDSIPVEVDVTPMFNQEKLIVEIAAGGHSILILPYKEFELFAEQGGLVPLDSLFDKEKYKDGIITYKDPNSKDQAEQTHLLGVPMNSTAWFKNSGYTSEKMYAFIPGNTPNVEQSKQILQQIMKN